MLLSVIINQKGFPLECYAVHGILKPIAILHGDIINIMHSYHVLP